MATPVELYTSQDWIEIDAYEPGTFDSEPIELYTSSGWLVPYVGNAAQADTPLEVYTSEGWKGFYTAGGTIVIEEIIDDFQDAENKWTTSGTGNTSMNSYGFDGTTRSWRHQGAVAAHLRGAAAIDRGPQPGDRFEFWFRTELVAGSSDNTFKFAASATDDDDCYRVNLRHNASPTLSLSKIEGGEKTLSDDKDPSLPSNKTFRCEINWNRTEDKITACLYEADGTRWSPWAVIRDDSAQAGGPFTQPGIAIRTDAATTISWDEFKITTPTEVG